MRVKLCAGCPYSPRDLADYYDANSSSHLCFRCDSKRATAELAILVTANGGSQCATTENISRQRSKGPRFCGGKFELIRCYSSQTSPFQAMPQSLQAYRERDRQWLLHVHAARSFWRTEHECSQFLDGGLSLKRPCKGLVSVAVLVLWTSSAKAQEAARDTAHRHHPRQDQVMHEKFYSTWHMPDNPALSCCNNSDCYPTEIQYVHGKIYARRREDGKYILIPSQKIERNSDNTDGRNHLYAPPPTLSPTDTVYCFAMGGAT